MNSLIIIILIISSLAYAEASSSVYKEASFESLTHYAQRIISQEREAGPALIAIGGASGVGKSTFTKHFAKELEALGTKVCIFTQDDFINFNEPPMLSEEWGLRHINHLWMHTCLQQVRNGDLSVEKPCWNQIKQTNDTEILDLHEMDVVLFEGIYVLSEIEPLNLFQYCDFGIFVEAEEQDVRTWKWERELKRDCPKTKEEFQIHMDKVMFNYKRNIEPTRDAATFIIQKDTQHNISVLKKHY